MPAHAVALIQRIRIKDLAQLMIRVQNRQHLLIRQAVARQEQQHPFLVVFLRIKRIYADADALLRFQHTCAVSGSLTRRISRHQLFHALALTHGQAAVARQPSPDIGIHHLRRIDLGVGFLQHPVRFRLLLPHAGQIGSRLPHLDHRRILDNAFAHGLRPYRQTKQRHQYGQACLFHAKSLPFHVVRLFFRCRFRAFMLPDYAFPCRHRDVSNL